MAMLAVLLGFEGYLAVSGFKATDWIISNSGGPFAGPDDIDRARELRPLLALVAIECILLGVLAVVLGVAFLRRKHWARRAILVASVCLVAMAVAVIAVAPQEWGTQCGYIAFCIAYWLEWYEQRRLPSAL